MLTGSDILLRSIDDGFGRWDELLALILRSFAFMDGVIDPPSSAHRLTPEALRAKAADETAIAALAGEALVGCVFLAPRDDHFYLGKFAINDSAAGRPAAARIADEALVLSAPISFWGGVDPKTGLIADVRHPQHGASIAGRILFLPGTIGSSSASAVLLELVSAGRAPAAIVMHEPDAILLLGLVVAREIGLATPVAARLDRETFGRYAGRHVLVDGNWHLTIVM